MNQFYKNDRQDLFLNFLIFCKRILRIFSIKKVKCFKIMPNDDAHRAASVTPTRLLGSLSIVKCFCIGAASVIASVREVIWRSFDGKFFPFHLK